MRLVITREGEILADLPDYEGAVPRTGDCIHWPDQGLPEPGVLSGFRVVKQVIWGIVGRGRATRGMHTGISDYSFVEVIV